MRLEVYVTLSKTAAVFWDVTPCKLYGSTDVAEKSASGYSETLVNSYQTTRCH